MGNLIDDMYEHGKLSEKEALKVLINNSKTNPTNENPKKNGKHQWLKAKDNNLKNY